jgi:hypothetical protein
MYIFLEVFYLHLFKFIFNYIFLDIVLLIFGFIYIFLDVVLFIFI